MPPSVIEFDDFFFMRSMIDVASNCDEMPFTLLLLCLVRELHPILVPKSCYYSNYPRSVYHAALYVAEQFPVIAAARVNLFGAGRLVSPLRIEMNSVPQMPSGFVVVAMMKQPPPAEVASYRFDAATDPPPASPIDAREG